jgi:putative endonuclease
VSSPARRTAAQAAGDAAEEAAARHLERHGLGIVARNYRTRLGEIDLVAQEGPVLVFVEVRSRADARHGGALESITASKRRRIVAAARHFLSRLGHEPRCRFDVVAVEEETTTWLKGAFDAA